MSPVSSFGQMYSREGTGTFIMQNTVYLWNERVDDTSPRIYQRDQAHKMDGINTY